MTQPTEIGKEPPPRNDWLDNYTGFSANPLYADYWRRRALAAEGLLREMDMVAHQVRLSDWWTAEQEAGLENVRERVAAHFDQVKP